MYELRACLLALPLFFLGCVGVQAGGITDDDSAGDDDTTAPDDDDDSVGDDDDSAVGDEIVDDDTCDEGASSEQIVRFNVRTEDQLPFEGAQWRVFDHDPTTGEVMEDVVAEGVTGADGEADPVLDCAHGWMMLEVTAADHATRRDFFRVSTLPGARATVLMTTVSIEEAVGADIADPAGGFAVLIKRSTSNSADMQGDDSCTIDGGPELIPWDAENENGLFIFDGAFGLPTAGFALADEALPGSETVVYLEYEDVSNVKTTGLNFPVWSYSDGVSNNMTVVTVDS